MTLQKSTWMVYCRDEISGKRLHIKVLKKI